MVYTPSTIIVVIQDLQSLFSELNLAFVAPLLVSCLGLTSTSTLASRSQQSECSLDYCNMVRGGKKHLPSASLYPSDPLEPNDAKKLSIRVGLGVVVFALVLLLLQVMGSLSLSSFITLLSIIAVATPIIYFIIIISSKKLSDTERSRVIAYIPLFIAAAIFWAIEEQGSVVLALFAQDQTNNTIHLFNWVIHINPANYQSLNPLFILIYTPIFATMWTKLGKKQPSSPSKFSMGMLVTGLSYLLLVIPISMFGAHSLLSPLWLVGSWAIVEIGELLISPIGLSVTTKLAPRAFQSSMMSMWFLADSAGQAVNSQIVKFYTPSNEIAYFSIIGIVSIIAGIILFFMIKPIKRLMEGVL